VRSLVAQLWRHFCHLPPRDHSSLDGDDEAALLKEAGTRWFSGIDYYEFLAKFVGIRLEAPLIGNTAIVSVLKLSYDDFVVTINLK